MSNVYSLLREACGITQLEAAENVHDCRLDTVKSWSSDRRGPPVWAVNQLQSLQREIRAAGENFAKMIKRSSQGNVFVIGESPDDSDARACGFPSSAAQRQAIAIAISLLPDDAEIRVVARVRGAIPAPVMEKELMKPTQTDAQVFDEMTFEDGRCYTKGNMNRRKFERLEEVGWVKGISTNPSDVEYHLTNAGWLQDGLASRAAIARGAGTDPAPGGFQTQVGVQPRRAVIPKLKLGDRYTQGQTTYEISAIDAGVVTAKLLDGSELLLYADPILLPA